MPFGSLEADKAWLSALIVGEGSIAMYAGRSGVRGRGGWVSIAITNTEKVILDEAQVILESLEIGSYYTTLRRSDGIRKPCYHLWISGGYDDKLKLLELLYPYLVGKKAEIAQLAILFMESRLKKFSINLAKGKGPNGIRYSDYETSLVESIFTLNRKGVLV